MSEEKEAIEDLKLQIEQNENELPYSEECLKYKKVILNLIDKQEKEIEELKADKKEFLDSYSYVLKNYVAKEKIEIKIKQLEEKKKQLEKKNIDLDNYICNKDKLTMYANVIEILQELLGE